MKNTLSLLLIFCCGFSGIYSQTIFDAVKNNETGKIREYIAKKQNINLTDKNGASIFMYAVFYSDLETVKLLVTHGADPKKKGILYRDQTSYYGSPLCAAAGSGRIETVRYLVELCKIPVNEKELDAETKTETGWTALHWAAWEGHTGICKYLLEQGADINAIYTGDQGTPLIYSINNNKTETALYLIHKGANVNHAMPGNIRALHLCANLRQTKVLEAIVKKSDNVNVLTDEGFTALMLAAYRYHFSCCDILLAHGANPALKNQHGYSALDYSANYPLLNGFLRTGQNPVSLIDKARIPEYISIAVDFYWSGKYGETVDLIEKILPGIEEQFGAADTSNYGMMLSYAAYSAYMKEDYISAEKYYLKTIDVFHKANVRSPMYNYSLFYLNKMYREQGIFEKAEYTFGLLNESHKTNSGELSDAYFQSLTDFASFYQDYSRPLQAIAVYKNLMDLKLKRFGKSGTDYLDILIKLAELYTSIGNYADALWHYSEALRVNEQISGRNSGLYAKNLYHLASLNFENANYTMAEKEFREALSIQDRLYGKRHTDYLATNIGLAILYQAQANYSKAEKIFLESLEILKTSGDTLNADYAVILNNLAEFYRVTGEYSLSEGYFINAIGIQKQIGLHLSEDIATTYNNLGLLYYNTGNYRKSEALFIECLKIRKEILGGDHPNYASSLNNLSLVHRDLGNYESAVNLQLEAYQIREKAFGRIHPSVAVTLNNIGLIYLSHGEYSNARKAFLEAIDIQRKFFRKETVNLATYIDNYAYTLMEEKEFHEALPYMQEVLEIRKKLLGENHVHIATSHSNLGKVYLGLGKFSEAEKHFRNSNEIVRKSSGTFSNSYANSLIELALATRQQKKNSLTDSLMIEANSIYNHFARICEKFMSEKEKYYFMNSVFSIYSDIFYTYFLQRYHENPSFSAHFYNKLIYEKSMLLNSSLTFRKQINKSVNKELVKIRDEYQLINQRLIKAFTERDTVFHYQSMIDWANSLEKKMIDLLAAEGKSGGQILNYEQIRNSLSDTEAIVDFVNFRSFTNDWTDSIIYCALVIKRDFEAPRLFYLFNEEQMDKLLYRDPGLEKKYQGQNPEFYYIRNLYQNKKNQVDKSDSIIGISWKPFDELLNDVKKVYISPSGLLNQIAFDALPYNDSMLLSDRYRIEYLLNSSRLKLKPELFPADLVNVALFGGIQYDMDTTEMIQASGNVQINKDRNKAMIAEEKFLPDSSTRGVLWQNLNGTKVETTNIQNILLKGKIPATLYAGTEASEEVFKSFSGNSPSLLHVATHGYYFPLDENTTGSSFFSKKIRFTSSTNPLLRSGILFAGGNRIWTGEKLPQNVQDGVLTAMEASQLDLLNTRLVVLSACQTGLGDFSGNEGVYGLQRAFKMAGVDYLIVSLWQVPDATTQELMEKFYTYWLLNNNISDAFHMAQNDLKKKYSAYGWAAFVLIY